MKSTPTPRMTFHPKQVAWLQERFPEVIVDPDKTSPHALYYQAGVRMVVHAIAELSTEPQQ